MLEKERLQEKERSPGLFGRLLRKVDGCVVRFIFDGKMDESMVTVDDPYERTSERMHLFSGSEPVCGRVVLTPKGTYRHNGILLELVGVITTFGESEEKIDFMRQEKKFEPDTFCSMTSLEFHFTAPREYESYRGTNARVSYYVRATIYRPVKNITEVEEVWVSKVDAYLSGTQSDASRHPSYFRETVFGPQSISMDVGVENVLHIEFKYDKKIFHLQERVLGKVTFKVADMDIRCGEVGVVRKEFIGPGKSTDAMQSETLQKFEIMDGTPVVGEVVPIRLYLRSIPHLTPTYPNVHNCFRVLYFLNLVLITGEGKRYFKQQEITLYRRHGQEVPTGSMTQSP
ncbi:vacuolar protein sorting-associated protein [Trypanosoma rangeli]|uniref:Vacuolar protein sorting-associated protein n=1 Tax=Trypanosoma rangeli TaxID=5698 RepID=A0A422NA47_TRYRA|nr:vacuolar protein sorting-associated protein [Trypanosoma rangeli]RNF02358.1 vacuolar protein sorting-associated protein [Trypanosoma rangeli]|eukprot:RNF02358.1 vacuolar protein sorting-associated protein [Trypanosoma rangeli]